MIEAIGVLSPRDLYIGGWSRTHPAAPGAVLLATRHGIVQGRLSVLWSDRADVGAGNCFCGVLQLDRETDAADVVAVQLAGGGHLDLYNGVVRVSPQQAVALLREALRKPGFAPARVALEGFAHRYDGTDTVTTSPLPIRLGIDDCVWLAGDGLLLSGWLYDPERLMRAVSLCGYGGPSQRIDAQWVGHLRPDVTASFSQEPRFAGYRDIHDGHGFAALVTGASPAPSLHLSIDCDGSPPLFTPLVSRTGNTAALLHRFVAGLDPDAPGTLDCLERLVAPVLAAANRRRLPVLHETALTPPVAAPLALLLGCAGSLADAVSLMQILATYPALVALPLVLCADVRELAVHRGDLERQAQFLGLQLRFVAADGALDEVDALQAGVAATPGPLCLVAAAALPAVAAPLATLLSSDDPPTIATALRADANGDPLALLLPAGNLGRAANPPLRLSAARKWQDICAATTPANRIIAVAAQLEPPPVWHRLLLHVDLCAAFDDA